MKARGRAEPRVGPRVRPVFQQREGESELGHQPRESPRRSLGHAEQLCQGQGHPARPALWVRRP
eukprot:11166990-Lingulodinium_polyedra.AAC.1